MRSGYDLIPSWAQYQTHVITPKASRAKDLDVTRPPQHQSELSFANLKEARFFKKKDHENVALPAL